MRDFNPRYDGLGSTSAVSGISAARLLYPETGHRSARSARQQSADFVAEVGDYYARGLPRFVDTSSYYAAFGER